MQRLASTPATFIRLLLLGALAATYQTLFSREFLSAFSGNEAVLAALLGPWMVLTAMGAALGRNGPPRAWAPAFALLAHGLLSAATLLVTRLLPHFFAGGASPGPAHAFLFASVLLAPTCILSGLIFSWFASALRSGARAYLAECLGSALAGACLGLWLLPTVPSPVLFSALIILASIAASVNSKWWAPCLVGGFALAAMVAWLPVGRWTWSVQGSHLANAVEYSSPHASLLLTREGEQVTLYANRLPVVSGQDDAAAEEAAHIPLSFHPRPHRVTVVGVPPVGTIQQLLHHGVNTVDWLVDDPVLLTLLRANIPDFQLPGLVPHHGDGRRFLREHAGALDAVLVFSPEPVNAGLNRLFTAELYAAIKHALRPHAVVAVSLPGHAAHAALETRRLHSSVTRTLEAVFGTVRVLPATRTYYLCSVGQPLPSTAEAATIISQTLVTRAITPRVLDAATLNHLFSPQRLASAAQWSALPEAINRDLHPTTYALALERALAEVGDSGTAVLAVLALALMLGALLVYRPRARPTQFAVLTSGATSLGAQLLLMLAYQAASGALYQEIAVLLAGFMLGAAAGSWIGMRVRVRIGVLGSDLMLGGALLGIGLLLHTVVTSSIGSGILVFLLTGVVGLLPGIQFAAASHDHPNPGAWYAADLVGASIAALCTFTFLVPALGLPGSFMVLASFKVFSSIALALPETKPLNQDNPSRFASVLPLGFGAWILLVAMESTSVPTYAFTFWPPYQFTAVMALLLAMLASFETPSVHALIHSLQQRFQSLHVRVERLVFFVLLLPVATSPLGRCYFSVPFLFCHACPRQCVFGIMRPYLVPAALIANLHERTFCERVCPLGTVQVACDGLRNQRAWSVQWLRWVRLFALAWVVMAYVLVNRTAEGGVYGEGWFAGLFRNTFAPSVGVLAASVTLLIGSFFIRRPFCGALCPVGATSSVLGRVERVLVENGTKDARSDP